MCEASRVVALVVACPVMEQHACASDGQIRRRRPCLMKMEAGDEETIPLLCSLWISLCGDAAEDITTEGGLLPVLFERRRGGSGRAMARLRLTEANASANSLLNTILDLERDATVPSPVTVAFPYSGDLARIT
ncbi:hypothetical protein GWK47_033119 [Chionoecetes opilio]|uniref:Uncharacterized protein n=1 Tax=Chionoecetes opilio TaxID=41210 RepID=A0A8J4YPT5_CHIOP|nr:hypothetical protein GWK47_033119 [Chionoecetes opilio]